MKNLAVLLLWWKFDRIRRKIRKTKFIKILLASKIGVVFANKIYLQIAECLERIEHSSIIIRGYFTISWNLLNVRAYYRNININYYLTINIQQCRFAQIAVNNLH